MVADVAVSADVDVVAALRAEMPVLERVTYLNAATAGPLPRAAALAATAAMSDELLEGRGTPAHFYALDALRARLAERIGEVVGRPGGEIAVTRSASDGIA